MASLYRGKSMRTVVRELERLESLGFISISHEGEPGRMRLLVRFEAIEKY